MFIKTLRLSCFPVMCALSSLIKDDPYYKTQELYVSVHISELNENSAQHSLGETRAPVCYYMGTLKHHQDAPNKTPIMLQINANFSSILS